MLRVAGRPRRRGTDAAADGLGAGRPRRARITRAHGLAPWRCSPSPRPPPVGRRSRSLRCRGTPDAPPATQISILGTAASNIESVTATGSISGSHIGTLQSYVSSPGASFVPQLPFTEGEEVHVVVHLKEGSPARRLLLDRAPRAGRKNSCTNTVKSPKNRNTS